MSKLSSIPPTRVLAIASHVTYGYVGNTMATFVLQSMGCEAAAINTVNFSNHAGYKQLKGTRTSASEIRDIYEALKLSYLTDFDVLLSGYTPSAETVQAVGFIARDLQYKATGSPGAFFWGMLLDPVMGDQGKLYVSDTVVPAYKDLLPHADLILPNQFEAETLTDFPINSLSTLANVIRHLHRTHRIPHVLITSVILPDTPSNTLTLIGSSCTTSSQPRLFRISIPHLPCFFSGTGDMFAALLIARLREASAADGLLNTRSWMPDDGTPATETPLAKATEKVLASMQIVLEKTIEARDEELKEGMKGGLSGKTDLDGEGNQDNGEEKRMFLARTKASEVRVVANAQALREPDMRDGKYRAVEVVFEEQEETQKGS